MTTEKENILHDRHAAALDEAAALRALHKYRAARKRALDHGAELGVSQPEPPDYTVISGWYYGIMAEWLNEPIGNNTAALSAINLLAEIAADRQLDDALNEGTGPASSEEDHADILRLIARLHEWVNAIAIDEAITAERRQPLREGTYGSVMQDKVRAAMEILASANTAAGGTA